MTTDELRAKFEAWWTSPRGFSMAIPQTVESHFRAYQAAHASRDVEVEALRKDAERYRWIRANAVEGRMESQGPRHVFALNCDEPEREWDAAIDAAMREESK